MWVGEGRWSTRGENCTLPPSDHCLPLHLQHLVKRDGCMIEDQMAIVFGPWGERSKEGWHGGVTEKEELLFPCRRCH
jgi:hypothetical protein